MEQYKVIYEISSSIVLFCLLMSIYITLYNKKILKKTKVKLVDLLYIEVIVGIFTIISILLTKLIIT